MLDAIEKTTAEALEGGPGLHKHELEDEHKQSPNHVSNKNQEDVCLTPGCIHTGKHIFFSIKILDLVSQWRL